jgi:hypothetical protein
MSEELVTLAECPPGLFMTPDFHIGLKTEYGYRGDEDGRYYPEAYVGASGEFFWGGVSTHPERAQLKVIPLDCDELGHLKSRVEALTARIAQLEAERDAAREALEAANYENGSLKAIVQGWHYLAVGPDEMGDYYTHKQLVKASEPYASPALRALKDTRHD